MIHMRKFICPKAGCGREAKYESAVCEEVIVPAGRVLTRKPLGLQRVFSVICPIHGRALLLETTGHHVSMIPRRNRGKR